MSIKNFGGAIRLAILAIMVQVVALSCVSAQTQGIVETKLDNGLTVLMKEVRTAPVFTAQVWFEVGSRNEHNGITGLSHMLEHMLFNSSQNYKKGEISDMIRKRGGIENAATSMDFTYYWQLLGSENLEFSLQTLAERVGTALLTEEEFENERTVVLSELQGNENNPDRLLFHAVMATAFKAHPYHWPVIGWQSDVENVSVAKLREYYKTYYHPNNATLVLVGDFDSAKALELVKKHFGAKPAGPTPPPVYTTEPPQQGKRTVEVRREGSTERIMMGYRAPNIDHPDSYALTVLDQILSGGRSSRLYQAIVEKQLAMNVYTSSGSGKDPALFIFGASARQGVTADQLEKALREQIEIARTTLPTEQEMQAAKNQLEASLIFQNDSVSDQGEQIGYYATVTSWEYMNTLIPRIKAVTAEDVRRVAQTYLVDDSLTVGKFIPYGGSAAAGELTGPVGGAVHRESDDAWKRYSSRYSDGAALAANPATEVTSVAPAKAPAAKPVRTVLDNGMVVIVQENRSNPTIAISGYVKAGSYFDPEGKRGTASLTADMITRGTTKRTALQLAQEAEFVGADISASASVETLNFSAKSLSKDFPLMLDLISDQIRNASFPADQLEVVKGGLLSELERARESTRDQAFRAFYGSIYPKGHPYHRLGVSDAQVQLGSVTREDLLAFHRAYYRPDTTILVLVGDVNADEAVKAVKHHFGDWKTDGPTPKMDIPEVKPQTASNSIAVPMNDKSQVDVVFGHAMGVRRSSPDYYAVRVMNHILGGGGALGSIMGTEIREKQGLVYNVYSSFDSGLGAGPWFATLGTSPKNVDKAIESLKKITRDFVEKGATQEQYEQAREFLVGVFPIALESNEGIARTLLGAEFYGLGMDYIPNYPKIYRSVTLEQVNAAAKKYLRPDAATQVTAGPQ